MIRGAVFGRIGLIRGGLPLLSCVIRGAAFGGSGLIRRGLLLLSCVIRGAVFGGSGPIRRGGGTSTSVLYDRHVYKLQVVDIIIQSIYV